MPHHFAQQRAREARDSVPYSIAREVFVWNINGADPTGSVVFNQLEPGDIALNELGSSWLWDGLVWRQFLPATVGYTDEEAQDAVGTILTDTASINFTYDDVGNMISAAVLPAGVDHGGLGGLLDDDHTQYLLLAGRTSGQVAVGGTGSGDDLTLRSTSHATKGDIIFEQALTVTLSSDVQFGLVIQNPPGAATERGLWRWDTNVLELKVEGDNRTFRILSDTAQTPGVIPGAVELMAGDGNNSQGGAINVQSGSGVAGVGLNHAGGIIGYAAGDAVGTGVGGIINLTAGRSPSGVDGAVSMRLRGSGRSDTSPEFRVQRETTGAGGPGTGTFENLLALINTGMMSTSAGVHLGNLLDLQNEGDDAPEFGAVGGNYFDWTTGLPADTRNLTYLISPRDISFYLWNLHTHGTAEEFFRLYWSGNTCFLITNASGTGTLRNLTLNAGNGGAAGDLSLFGNNVILRARDTTNGIFLDLPDAAGSAFVRVRDSAFAEVATINSDGRVNLPMAGNNGGILLEDVFITRRSANQLDIDDDVAIAGKVIIGSVAGIDPRLLVFEPTTLGGEVFRLQTSEVTGLDPREQVFQNVIRTTDATVTTLHTVAITSGRTYHIEARVQARRTGGAAGTAEDGASYIVHGTYKTVAGTVTLIGALTLAHTAEDQAAWDTTLTISGTNVLVRVTGSASNNITWHGTIRVWPVES